MGVRKVLIIDDEKIICDLILRLGEWEKLQLEVVAVSTDGLEGYQRIRELQPDIVLLDIRMPGLDGLELVARCYQEKLRPHFIIISGYQEFAYAQKAMQFHISDYLVKPIDRDELNMALKKAVLAIEETQKRQDDLQTLQTDLQTKNRTLWRLFFEKTMAGEVPAQFPDACGNRPWPETHGEQLCVGLMQLESPWDNREWYERQQMTHFESLWAERMGWCLDRSGYAQADGRIFFLAALRQKECERFLKAADGLVALADKYMQGFDGCRVTVGLSFCQSRETLPACCKQAACSLERRFLDERGRAYAFAALPGKLVDTVSEASKNTAVWEEQVRLAFVDLDARAFSALLEALYAGDVGLTGVQSRVRLRAFAQVFFSVAAGYFENGAAPEKQQQIFWLCETEKKPKQLFARVVPLLKEIFSQYLESQTLWKDRHVRSALQYIRAHYADDLQLDDVAAAIGLNPAYLSGLIKSKTNMTYSEHLLHIRMEQAKALLSKPGSVVKNVCGAVGYHDVKYFSRQFKQYTGVNPSVYQRMHSVY